MIGPLTTACLARERRPTTPEAIGVAIGVSQFGQVVEVADGETVTLRRPMDVVNWQVDYSSDVLEMLTPANQVKAPGPEGWRLKARARGTTDLTLTALMPANQGGGPPPAPPRFTVTIKVR